MNPMAAAAVGSVLRWALAIGAGYLIRAGVWTSADAGVYVTAATFALVSLGWSQYEKYWSRLKLLTALATVGRTTEAAVIAQVQTGVVPALSTPVTVVPIPTAPARSPKSTA